MDAEKNFSGCKWTSSRRDAAGRESSRVLQNATKGTFESKRRRGRTRRRKKEREREEAARVQKQASYELLRQRVYEVPVDRMPPSEGGHVAPLRKRKTVILLCVTGITRVSLREVRLGRLIAPALMRLRVRAISRRATRLPTDDIGSASTCAFSRGRLRFISANDIYHFTPRSGDKRAPQKVKLSASTAAW